MVKIWNEPIRKDGFLSYSYIWFHANLKNTEALELYVN